VTRAFLRHVLTNRFVDVAATVPLLAVLCLREVLRAEGYRVGERWVHRLGWCVVFLLPLFVAVIAGRFAVLSF
jgi:hypothetical protein